MMIDCTKRSGVRVEWRDWWRRPSWVLWWMAAFVFMAPNVDLASSLEWHDGQRIAQLVVLALVLSWMLRPRAGHQVVQEWQAWPLFVRFALASAFLTGLLSALQAALPRWALLDWGLLLLLLVCALAVATERRRLGEHADHALILLLFATAAAYAATTCVLYGTMLLVGPEYGQGFDVRELYGGFSNLRFFGYVQTMLLPFLLLPAMFWGRTMHERLLWGVVPALWWMLAVASGTRGTWVALLAGAAVVVFSAGKTGRHWAKWQIGGLLGGLVFYAIFIKILPQFVDMPVSFLHRQGDILGLSRREVIWVAAWHYAIQHPWLGIGPMHFSFFANDVAAHPHNALLQWMAEWGMPATVLFCIVWAWGGWVLLKKVHIQTDRRTVEPRALFQAAVLASLTGASAQAMVDGVLVMPVSQMLCVLLAGWAMGMSAGKVRSAGEQSWCAKLLPLVLLPAAVIAWGVAPEISNLESRQRAYMTGRAQDAVLHPRFWTQGWISR